MAWLRVEDLRTWDRAEMYFSKTNEGDVPVYVRNREYLLIAQRHLDANDLRAAAIYIRAAYEFAIKRFCDKWNREVRYCENPKEQNSIDFWKVVKSQKRKTGGDLLLPKLINDLELFRASIMNQLSHTAPINFVRKEVEEALATVKELQVQLQSIKPGELQ